MAVDNIQAVKFVNGTVKDPEAYDFENPCPDTVTRISNFDAAATTAGTAKFAPISGLSPTEANCFVILKPAIDKADRGLAASILAFHVITPKT